MGCGWECGFHHWVLYKFPWMGELRLFRTCATQTKLCYMDVAITHGVLMNLHNYWFLVRDHPFLWVKHLNSLEFQTPKRPYLVPTLVAEVNVLFWYFFRISRDAQCCILASTNSSFFAAQKRLTMFSAGCNENSPQQISGLSCSDCESVSTAKQSRV